MSSLWGVMVWVISCFTRVMETGHARRWWEPQQQFSSSAGPRPLQLPVPHSCNLDLTGPHTGPSLLRLEALLEGQTRATSLLHTPCPALIAGFQPP